MEKIQKQIYNFQYDTMVLKAFMAEFLNNSLEGFLKGSLEFFFFEAIPRGLLHEFLKISMKNLTKSCFFLTRLRKRAQCKTPRTSLQYYYSLLPVFLEFHYSFYNFLSLTTTLDQFLSSLRINLHRPITKFTSAVI